MGRDTIQLHHQTFPFFSHTLKNIEVLASAMIYKCWHSFALVVTALSAVGGAVGGAATVPLSSDTDREIEATQEPPQGK